MRNDEIRSLPVLDLILINDAVFLALGEPTVDPCRRPDSEHSRLLQHTHQLLEHPRVKATSHFDPTPI